MLDRRSALLALLGSAAASLFGRKAPPLLPGPTTRRVALHQARVFGLPYHDAPRVLPTLKPGQPLVLRREPENPHDDLAVAVLTPAGSVLGHLAREDVEVAARLLDAGQDVGATLVAVRPNGWNRLVVVLDVALPAA